MIVRVYDSAMKFNLMHSRRKSSWKKQASPLSLFVVSKNNRSRTKRFPCLISNGKRFFPTSFRRVLSRTTYKTDFDFLFFFRYRYDRWRRIISPETSSNSCLFILLERAVLSSFKWSF